MNEEREPLTAREWDVALLIVEGLVTKQVAAEIGLSPATVKGHVEAIYHKLGIHSRVELAKWVWNRTEREG